MKDSRRFTHTISFVVTALLILGTQARGANLELAWDPPTNNVDGTPLNDSVVYKVYYGESSGVYPNTVDAGAYTECTVSGLVEGVTYYFTATAINSIDSESDFAQEISAMVPDETPPEIAPPSVAALSADADGSVLVPDLISLCVISDNVSDAARLVVTQTPVADTRIGLGTTLVTIAATDEAGNSSDAVIPLLVIDDTPPSLTPPEDADLPGDAHDQALVPDFCMLAMVSDNCSAADAITVTQSPAAGTVIGLGTTTVVLTATDEAGNAGTATVDVTVTPMNRAPTVNAGEDAVTQLPNASVLLAAEVIDDGLPSGQAVTVLWTVVDGDPADVTFTDATDKETSVKFSESGTYTLRLTASDGELSGSDTLTVTVKPKRRPKPPTGLGVVTRK